MSGKNGAKQHPAGGLREEPREFVAKLEARFAPADNLYDAIRFDIAPLGEFEFTPLDRRRERGIPFFDPDAQDE